MKSFLTLKDIESRDLLFILNRSMELKKSPIQSSLRGKTLVLIFEQESTRTRLSLQIGMQQMGGNTAFLSEKESQIGRGERIEDSAKVISTFADVVSIRTSSHDKLEVFTKNATIPVINALSNMFHPCQLLADMQTFMELRGSIQGKKVAWVGDGYNMCQSYINAASQLDFELVVATPEGRKPAAWLLEENQSHVRWINDPYEACENADLIATDTWDSMSQENENPAELEREFAGYQVNTQLTKMAKEDFLFMHCLPAYRDKEVSAEVFESPHSVVWHEAENRLHSQKALLEYLLCPPSSA